MQTNNEWITDLSLDELKYFATPLFVYENDSEEAAKFMYREGYHRPMASAEGKEELRKKSEAQLKSRPPKKYWDHVKQEIFLLICENDPKYDELRKKLNTQSEKGTNVLIATISATFGSTLGVHAGILSGFCALALHGVIKVGIESYCSCNNSKK